MHARGRTPQIKRFDRYRRRRGFNPYHFRRGTATGVSMGIGIFAAVSEHRTDGVAVHARQVDIENEQIDAHRHRHFQPHRCRLRHTRRQIAAVREIFDVASNCRDLL